MEKIKEENELKKAVGEEQQKLELQVEVQDEKNSLDIEMPEQVEEEPIQELKQPVNQKTEALDYTPDQPID